MKIALTPNLPLPVKLLENSARKTKLSLSLALRISYTVHSSPFK